MEREELRTQVRAMVDGLFDEKEESEIRRKTEIALGKSAETISNLTSTLEEKVAEIAELETKASEGTESIQSLEKELEATREELETSKALVTEKEQVLEDMSKAKVADERMVELESAGIARAEKEVQLAKVKEMSNEEFTSYKEELVDVRKAVEAELEKATKDSQAKKAGEDAEKAKAEEEKLAKLKEGETTEGEGEEEADETTTPAKITPGQAAMASLNMEFMPNEDLMAKYAKLGEALAAKWKDNSKE